MNTQQVIEVDSEKMGGTPVFSSTRVPIQNFFGYLEGGETVEEFLDQFPTVEREQVTALFALIKERLCLAEDED